MKVLSLIKTCMGSRTTLLSLSHQLMSLTRKKIGLLNSLSITPLALRTKAITILNDHYRKITRQEEMRVK
jgi:hypothetical protein